MAVIGREAARAPLTSADINDGIVGAADLQSTLDLSSKTITMPSIASLDVTGNLTVDTNTLYVDATNNRVGIGTTTPAAPLDVAGEALIQGRLQVTASAPELLFSVPSGGLDSRIHNDGSGNFIFGTGTNSTTPTERMRIDSSGNVGIGTASISNSTGFKRLAINDTSGGILEQQVGGTATGRLITSAASVSLDAITSIPLTFKTAAIERARLDASGNLLVGTTTQYGATGITLQQDGLIYARRSGVPAYFRRDDSDGDIVYMEKDGAAVGRIGTSSSALYIGTGDTGLYFGDAANRIQPWDTTANAAQDATVDLGTSTNRFKDLYLSGGVYLGGTGAANKLEDYEEGSWTPAVTGSTTAGSYSSVAAFGEYTKIGNFVCVTAYFYGVSGTGSGDMVVGGFPFASSSEAATAIQYNSGLDLPTGTHTPMLLFNSGTSGEIRCSSDGTGSYSLMPYPSTVGYLRFSLTYQTT